MELNQTTLKAERQAFHAFLIANGTLAINNAGIPSNADKSQKSSIKFASEIARLLKVETVGERLAGQTAGGQFETAVMSFLQRTFPLLNRLRPGSWRFTNLGGKRRGAGMSDYVPFRHLDELARAIEASPTLQSVLGNAYVISPDVLVSRLPEPDARIEQGGLLMADDVGRYTPVREANQPHPILHAVVSCKWTLSSDRAQNARSEALNLVRNRKGRLPHIVVVTGEPTPSRISSLALGTGDIDCVYHFALPEMIEAVAKSGNDEALNLLMSMVNGERLRDIADLPLDLAV